MTMRVSHNRASAVIIFYNSRFQEVRGQNKIYLLLKMLGACFSLGKLNWAMVGVVTFSSLGNTNRDLPKLDRQYSLPIIEFPSYSLQREGMIYISSRQMRVPFVGSAVLDGNAVLAIVQ